jgi:hypothetical protein
MQRERERSEAAEQRRIEPITGFTVSPVAIRSVRSI